MRNVMGVLERRRVGASWGIVLLSPLLWAGYLSLALCPHFHPAGLGEHAACASEYGPADRAQNRNDGTCCASHVLKAMPAEGMGFAHPTPAVFLRMGPGAPNLTARSTASAAAFSRFHPPRDRLTYLLNHSFLL